MDYEPADSAVKPRRSWLQLLALPVLAFIAGIAAMAWLLTSWHGAATWLGVAPVPPPVQQPAPTQVSVEPDTANGTATGLQEPERLVIDPEMTRRVSLLEQRLADIDVQSRTAVGNADRAEGLLVAFAARRAIDRGAPLGYLEVLLRQRFAATQPQAVAEILTAARQPVTLQELQDGLQEIGPRLSGGPPDQSWWTAFKSEVAGLVTIRKTGTPSVMPAERLRRAARRLDSGQVVVALAEVIRMPGRAAAGDWIAKARRYVTAHQALDRIETAALVEARPAPAG